MTNDEARVLLTSADVLALTMFGEARGEPVEGRIAVGCAVRNRLKTPARFGETFAHVCWQRKQFSCWNDDDPNSAMLWQHARSIASNIRVLDPILKETLYLAAGITSVDIRDNSNGATHYYAPAGMKPVGDVPYWAKGVTPVARIGSQLFFRGV